MQINFLGGPLVEEFDTTVHEVHVWYDHGEFRTWCVTKYNEAGDTLGDSEFMHFKKDAVRAGTEISEVFGAKLMVFTKKGTF